MWYDGGGSPDGSPVEHKSKLPLTLESLDSLPAGVNEPCGDIPKARLQRKISFDRQIKFLLKAEQQEEEETSRLNNGVHLPQGWGRSAAPASSSADAHEVPPAPYLPALHPHTSPFPHGRRPHGGRPHGSTTRRRAAAGAAAEAAAEAAADAAAEEEVCGNAHRWSLS